MSGFVIRGLDPTPFRGLYGLGDAALAEREVVRMRVDATPGFPCRVTLEDVAPGADVLLLNFEHLPVATPYRARHAIFVREGADAPGVFEDIVPDVLARRLLSLRAFDAEGMMTDADVIDGADLAPVIARMLADPAVVYLHAHNAKRGCFAARIDRR